MQKISWRTPSSHCQGILEGEMLKHGLKAYVPSSPRLLREDLSRSCLGEGGNVLIDASSGSLVLVTEEAARHFAVWLPPGERWCLFGGCDSPAKETVEQIPFFFFGCIYLTNSWGGKSVIFAYRSATLNSTSPAQRRGGWAQPGCWARFKSPAFSCWEKRRRPKRAEHVCSASL